MLPLDYGSSYWYNDRTFKTQRDVAQFGRAGALGASGRRFKSYRPDS